MAGNLVILILLIGIGVFFNDIKINIIRIGNYMPSPKVFVSSTCYDLGMAREQIRSFLLRLGYDPILSEYSDVLYDTRTHTHTSCIQEVPNADMVVLIIGSRFGGNVVPEALSEIDLDNLTSTSFDVTALNEPEKLSITQLETLKAIDSGVPVFTFVDEKVMHDHFVYSKNKKISDDINFPSIEKADSAKYIFEFINFLKHRAKGNNVISFSRIEDIENHLRKQWGALFQRLLREEREKTTEANRMISISEQIDDLKAAMFSTIDSTDARDVARGVIKYRRLIDFLNGIHLPDINSITNSNAGFDHMIKLAKIVDIKEIPDPSRSFPKTALIKEDGTYFELRYGSDNLSRLSHDWQSYIAIASEARKIIYETISDMGGRTGFGMVRERHEVFSEVFSTVIDEEKNGTLASSANVTLNELLGAVSKE